MCCPLYSHLALAIHFNNFPTGHPLQSVTQFFCFLTFLQTYSPFFLPPSYFISLSLCLPFVSVLYCHSSCSSLLTYSTLPFPLPPSFLSFLPPLSYIFPTFLSSLLPSSFPYMYLPSFPLSPSLQHSSPSLLPPSPQPSRCHALHSRRR